MQSSMMNSLAGADVYTDLNSLAKIKQQSRGSSEDKEQALEAVAKQFESVFMNMMMKAMREANEAFKDESMSGSNEMQFYQQMFDQQLTLSLSKTGMGLSDALVRQLKTQIGGPVNADTLMSSTTSAMNPFTQALRKAEVNIPQLDEEYSAMVEPLSLSGEPQEFKQALWSAAEKAAQTLGVDPRYLISQAALETGWGQKMITDSQGNNSWNMFGIKASGNWDGKTADVNTLEYRQGIPQREVARFKAYDSLHDSFADYVDFVSQQPRYEKALQVADDPSAYIKELQAAGYATDPKYAEKIEAIVQQHFPDQG